MHSALVFDPSMDVALEHGLVLWGWSEHPELASVRVQPTDDGRGGISVHVTLHGKDPRDVTISVLSPLGQPLTLQRRADAGPSDQANCEAVFREVGLPGLLSLDVTVAEQTSTWAAPIVDASLYNPAAYDARAEPASPTTPPDAVPKAKRVRSPRGEGTGRKTLRHYVWRTAAKRAVVHEVRVDLDLRKPATRGRVTVSHRGAASLTVCVLDRAGRPVHAARLPRPNGEVAALWLPLGMSDDDVGQVAVWADDDLKTARWLAPDRTG